MKILFVEPPKRFWFVMGEYLPPPLGILELAAYVESKMPDAKIEVLDCQANRLDWDGLEKHIRSTDPDVVASSSLATCNAYTTARTLATAKKVNSSILTVAGGQHFTATADESLRTYPEIDVIIRGEGELTLVDLISAAKNSRPFANINGISFQQSGRVFQNPDRQMISNLDELPLPAYHFVEDHAHDGGPRYEPRGDHRPLVDAGLPDLVKHMLFLNGMSSASSHCNCEKHERV